MPESGGDVAAIVVPVLDDVRVRTREARKQTDREIAAIRACVDRVVAAAREELDQAMTAVGRGTDERAAMLLRRLEEVDAITSTHLERVEAIARRIAEVAQRGVEQCERMVQSSQAVKLLARRSRVLSLNTVVSANHLGALGAPISVVATEMTRIHVLVDGFAREVDRRAVALARVLPTLAGIAEALDTTTREHAARLQRRAAEGDALRLGIASTLEDVSRSLESRMRAVLDAAAEILTCLEFTDDFNDLLDTVDEKAGVIEASLGEARKVAV